MCCVSVWNDPASSRVEHAGHAGAAAASRATHHVCHHECHTWQEGSTAGYRQLWALLRIIKFGNNSSSSRWLTHSCHALAANPSRAVAGSFVEWCCGIAIGWQALAESAATAAATAAHAVSKSAATCWQCISSTKLCSSRPAKQQGQGSASNLVMVLLQPAIQ